MAASNTRFTQNSLGQSKTPIDSDHGIYRYSVQLVGRLLQCMSPVLALSGPIEMGSCMSTFGGILLQKLVVSHGWGHSLSF